MMGAVNSMVVCVNKPTLWRGNNERVGNGEKIEFQPYQNLTVLSNGICRSAGKPNKHTKFVDIVFTDSF